MIGVGVIAGRVAVRMSDRVSYQIAELTPDEAKQLCGRLLDAIVVVETGHSMAASAFEFMQSVK